MSHYQRSVALGGTLLLLLALPAVAGGPLNLNPNDPAGVERWPFGGANIPFNPDGVPAGGPSALALGPNDHTTAVAKTLAGLAAWQSIGTATQTYQNNGLLPFDVDATNFAPFVQNLFFGGNTADGLSPVVYDQDGSIFLALFGSSGVLGFASPDTRNVAGDPIEAVCFLNGGAITGGFPDPDFDGVIVHEFGHYSGLAHTVTNGENVFFGDESGPTPDNTTYGNSPINLVETMYPFAGVNVARFAVTPHADDVGILSFLYPAAGFFSSSGTVSGTILAPNNTTPLTGVNVIARNQAFPFIDAVSAISGDRGVTGAYTLNGLTPGASYTIHVDQILAGGFSTVPISLPGPEEFYNGANESNNIDSPDNPLDSATVTPSAGGTVSGVDVIFNAPAPGDALPVGDDGSVELFLPFDFNLCGQTFTSLFVNANGNVTFGAGDTDFTESVPDMLGGPPRIAGVWDDLNPSTGGTVTFDVTPNSFSVIWDDVPEWFATGSNSFEITLFDSQSGGGDDDDDDDGGGALGNEFSIDYGDVGVADGLAGFSCGNGIPSGLETASDLSALAQPIDAAGATAIFELFDGFSSSNDLGNSTLDFGGTTSFSDVFEPNDSTRKATRIRLPFDSVDNDDFTSIDPVGGDVDYFRFKANAGETLIAEVLTGQLDSTLGLFQAVGGGDDDDDGGNAVLVASDDDGGTGLLSKLVFPITESGTYFLAVSAFPDLDFNGDGGSGGRYRFEAFTIQGSLLALGDDNSIQVSFGFNFPYQGGNHSSVFVNSNGNLTFGVGDSDFTESVGELLSGPPRIAPLWDDLSPNNAGLVVANEGTNCLSVAFVDVPEFFNTGANNFEVVFDSSGNVNLNYGSITAGDGLVGITQGNGAADPGGSDLSTAGPFSATGTTYELFNSGNPNDLNGATVVFGNPIGPCGASGGGEDDDDEG